MSREREFVFVCGIPSDPQLCEHHDTNTYAQWKPSKTEAVAREAYPFCIDHMCKCF
jgi:hypothetical protein